jgi:hypothetical protein
VSVASVSAPSGVSGDELVGTAHNLRTAADIAGTYKAVGQPGLRSAPADRWHGFRMRTVYLIDLKREHLAGLPAEGIHCQSLSIKKDRLAS